MKRFSFCLAIALSPTLLHAQAGIPPSRDVPFKGVIRLDVDASDRVHDVLTVRETVPVTGGGDVVLRYPQWDTASHAPTIPLAGLAGLVVKADGRVLPWKRDTNDLAAFHVDVPRDATLLDLSFDVIGTTGDEDFLNLAWQNAFLYPAGWYLRNIPVDASLRFPAAFQIGTSLTTTERSPGFARFTRTRLDDLADAPVYAGRFVRRVELTPGAPTPVAIDVFGEQASDLAVSPETIAAYQRLIVQAGRVFGAPRYHRYEFLAAVGKTRSTGGAEHLQSSEISFAAEALTSPAGPQPAMDIAAHEYVHGWNGRFRQPADLWAPDLNTPMHGSLLWVYEGQTQLWGHVLAARSGMRDQAQALDALAVAAASMQARPGRSWKSLQDSTNDPVYMAGRRVPWRDWQRREDYYDEGILLWLDVDTRLRELTGEKVSIDDFARAFFDLPPGSAMPATYTFEDICATLNTLAPFDWRGLLTGRLNATNGDHLLDGLTRGGYRLVFTEVPSAFWQDAEAEDDVQDLVYSLGAAVGRDGKVRRVSWKGPAFDAGLTVGTKIVGVNGHPFDDALLRKAIAASTTTPIDLAIERGGKPLTVRIDYRGPLRYPHLERLPGSPDRLGALLRPR